MNADQDDGVVATDEHDREVVRRHRQRLGVMQPSVLGRRDHGLEIAQPQRRAPTSSLRALGSGRHLLYASHRYTAPWLTAIAVALITGCSTLHGRPLSSSAPPPDAHVESFEAARPAGDPHSLVALRTTLEFWRTDVRGRPRYDGSLYPSRPDLYEAVIQKIDAGASRITLYSDEYFRIGWDRFSTVWYVDDDSASPIGFDYTLAGAVEDPPAETPWIGWDNLTWWEVAQLPLDVVVFGAIGIKESVFEFAKAPLTGLEILSLPCLLPPDSPWVHPSPTRAAGAVAEDLRHAGLALSWRVRVRHQHTPLWLAQELLASLPVLGPFVSSLWTSQAPAHRPGAGDPMIVVSQGVYAQGPEAQLVAAWARQIEHLRPEKQVRVIPNVHSGIFDVLFSLLNLSNGYAYDGADRVLVALQGERSVEMVGFSGGVQRFIVAGNLLGPVGVRVDRFTGIAGPSLGPPPAVDAVVMLDAGLSPDLVVGIAKVVGVADILSRGGLLRVDVQHAGQHHVPYFPDGRTRAPNAGYAKAFEARFARNE